MNGLLAIVKNEHEQLAERDKTTSTKKDEGASSPMSALTRPISASPTVDFGKRVGGDSVHV